MKNKSFEYKIYKEIHRRTPGKLKQKTLLTFGAHSLYQSTQAFLNRSARKFLGKKDINPNQKSFVNKLFFVAIDKSSADKLNENTCINYGDLKYIHQPRVLDCADTSVKMMMNYHIDKCKEMPDRQLSLVLFQRRFEQRKINLVLGKTFQDIHQYAQGYIDVKFFNKAQKANITRGEVARLLYKFGPLVFAIKGNLGEHAIVVKGIVDNEVVIQDPWYGPNLTFSFEDFKKMWTGEYLYFNNGYSNALENDILEEKNRTFKQDQEDSTSNRNRF